jgi:hypothetical protein
MAHGSCRSWARGGQQRRGACRRGSNSPSAGVRGGWPDKEAAPKPGVGGLEQQRPVGVARCLGRSRSAAQPAQPGGKGWARINQRGQRWGGAGVRERRELTSFLAVTKATARFAPQRIPTAADEVLRREAPETEVLPFDWREKEASWARWAAVWRRRGEQRVLIGASGSGRRAQATGGGDGPVRGGRLRRDLGMPMILGRCVGGKRGHAWIEGGGWGKRGRPRQDLTREGGLSFVVSPAGGIRVRRRVAATGRGWEVGAGGFQGKGGVVGRGLERGTKPYSSRRGWALTVHASGSLVSAHMHDRRGVVHVSAERPQPRPRHREP